MAPIAHCNNTRRRLRDVRKPSRSILWKQGFLDLATGETRWSFAWESKSDTAIWTMIRYVHLCVYTHTHREPFTRAHKCVQMWRHRQGECASEPARGTFNRTLLPLLLDIAAQHRLALRDFACTRRPLLVETITGRRRDALNTFRRQQSVASLHPMLVASRANNIRLGIKVTRVYQVQRRNWFNWYTVEIVYTIVWI